MEDEDENSGIIVNRVVQGRVAPSKSLSTDSHLQWVTELPSQVHSSCLTSFKRT